MSFKQANATLLSKIKRWSGCAALGLTPLISQAATVDVLFLYDSYSNQHFNGQPATALQSWVTQANGMYKNSNVDIQLRLVGALATEMAGADMGEVLGNLRQNTWVAQKRNELGADFVVQVHSKGSCGIGYVAVHRDWAFNVTGPTCGAQVLAHELGHNMGLVHSRAQGDVSGSRYRYGIGHGVNGSFATIMAYPQVFNAPWLPKFSSPNLTCNGLPCGVPAGQANEADGAQALHNVSSEIANFMPTRVGGGDTGGDTGGETGTNVGTYVIRAKQSGRCVDVSGGSSADRANVIQWSCHSGNNQRWILNQMSDGHYQIKSKLSGKCLDVADSSSVNGANVQQLTCNNNGNQRWKLDYLGDGSYKMTAKHSGKVMDITPDPYLNGQNVRQWAWVNATNQRFTFQRVE